MSLENQELATAPPRDADGDVRSRWAERPILALVLKLLVVLAPIAVSVFFVAVVSRIVARPARWYGIACWWIGLTLASTTVLAATERLLRRFLPLVALFRLSLIFPDHSPSRFKVAMRTNTLRQLQRTLEAGELHDLDFQDAAERLVALAGALNAHDRLTRGHTERVRAYTLMIGEELRLPKADLDRLHWSGLVHDIGKLEVPTSILNKAGRPDDDEWQILKQHPAAAVRLLEPLRGWLGEWADAASQHHERWDGKGYPLGLAGNEISLSGRIVAVADAFDVMTSVRSYKKAMTPEAARAELLRCAGAQFHADVVRAFLNISVGKLRLVMGPLSWLAQAPALGNVPLGTAAATAMSSLVSIGLAVGGGLTANHHVPAVPAAVHAQAPVAQPITISSLEDQPIDVRSAMHVDQPADVVTLTLVPDHTNVEPAAPLVLVPAANWFGEATGQYQACWGKQCSTAAVHIIVQPANDAPTASPDGASTPQGTGVTIDVLGNDHDVEDARPLLSGVGAVAPVAAATATVTADSRVLVQPAVGFVGTLQIPYDVVDSDGAVATSNITVMVTAVDAPPRAFDDSITTPTGVSQSVDVLANDVDDEHEPLTVVSVTPPSIGEVVLTANMVTFSPPAGTSGATTFTYTIEDSNGGRGQATVHVDIVDASAPPQTTTPTTTPAAPTTVAPTTPPPTTVAPTTAPPQTTTPATTPVTTPPVPPSPVSHADSITIIEDGAQSSVDVLANDTSADGDSSNDTVTIIGQPTLGAAQMSGQQIRYQPAADANGTDAMTYQVCETTSTCDTATLTVSILPRNDAPSFLASGSVTVPEDSGAQLVSGWATALSTGPANESLQNIGFTVTIDQPALFDVLPVVDSNGRLTFTPATDANGSATITVAAVDDGGITNGGVDASPAQTATITITSTNDAPTFADAGDVGAMEDDAAVAITGWAGSISAGPANESGQSVGFGVLADQPTLFQVQPAVDATGTLTFTPAANANGVATISVTATDDGGTSNGGIDTSATHTATITITSVNDPVVATADAATVTEDDPAGVTVNVLTNDTDADADSLTVLSINTTNVTGGTVTDLGSGSYNYTPGSNFNGTDSFTYTVSDGHGSTDTATVTITITPVADAPVASADAFSTSEDASRIVTAPGVMANDFDEDGDTLSITTTPVSGPTHGAVILGSDGSFTYTPTIGFVGNDSFTYRLNDSTGLSATATVTITVDSGLTSSGLYLGNTATLGTWNMTVGAPATASPEPDYDLDGHPGITVAKDGLLGTKIWIRNISSTALALNGPMTLELWSTIANFDPTKDGHPDVTISDCTNLGTGCVVLNHTAVHMTHYNGGVANWVKIDVSLGSLTHTFPVGHQLRLQVQQGHNDMWIATTGARPSRLLYTVANTAPVAVNDNPPVILEDSGATSIDVLANDTDTNLDSSSVTITSSPSKGSATAQPDGTVLYQPNANANGTDSFTYQVCDTGGLCAPATVTVTITAVNDQPGFVAGSDITVNASDGSFVQAGWATGITAGSSNESGQTLTFLLTPGDPSLFTGQLVVSSAGSISFVPSGTTGTTTVSIQLVDNGGTANGGSDSSAVQIFNVTVN